MASDKTRGKAFIIVVAVAALAVGFLLVGALMRGYGGGTSDVRVGGAADPAQASQQTQQPQPTPGAAKGGAAAGGDQSPFALTSCGPVP